MRDHIEAEIFELSRFDSRLFNQHKSLNKHCLFKPVFYVS
ncbi:hypothetical protein SPWS13_2962 [Shewanella putrefaciens]|nr:hypothetical protein SPWS13_2962 [Shewanella putrefaciens]